MKKIHLMTAVCLCLFCTACSSSKDSAGSKSVKPSEKSQEQADVQSQDQNVTRDMDKLTKVIFKTSEGDITIALYDNTPKHKENFLKLVGEGFYTDILFHRIIQGFMIQTGDPESKNAPSGKQLGSGGPGYTIPAEFRPENYHKRGAVAAARMGDQMNPTKASSGSQFYIVDGKKFDENYLQQISYQMRIQFTDEQKEVYKTIGGAPFLDMQYTVFGEVTEGMDVVDKIAAKQKDANDRPLKDVKIISASVVE